MVHQHLKFSWLQFVRREAQSPLAAEASPGQGGAECEHSRDRGRAGQSSCSLSTTLCSGF